MSKFTGVSKYKYKSKHPARMLYDYWAPESENSIPKVRFRKDWHKSKDVRCWFDEKAFYRDMVDEHFYPKNKENNKSWHKLEKRIKHKLYFNIPITEEDWKLCNGRVVNGWIRIDILREQQKNVEQIKEREKRIHEKN